VAVAAAVARGVTAAEAAAVTEAADGFGDASDCGEEAISWQPVSTNPINVNVYAIRRYFKVYPPTSCIGAEHMW